MAYSAFEGVRDVSGGRRRLIKAAACLAAFGPARSYGQQVEVALAGMAYSGDFASIDQRFFHSRAYEVGLEAAGRPAHAILRNALAQNAAPFRIVPQIDELKGRDQAIAVALVLGSETISVERLAGVHKLLVLIRAQALFFDFKSMSVIRAYPISFATIDTLDHAPGPEEIRTRVRDVFEGVSGKPGLFARFVSTIGKATLPAGVSRYIQVARIVIKPEAQANLPGYLTSSTTITDTWAADLVGEALSTRANVPIVPFAKGYAIGNRMSLRISDNTVYNLALPKPDYEIGIELSALRKIEYGKAAAGTSYIYGTYASVKIEEPLSGKSYLNAAFKNGEIKLVPATQTYVDDFPAFYDSVNGLFVKLSESLAGKGNEWVRTASAAPDIDRQIADTKELIRLCR